MQYTLLMYCLNSVHTVRLYTDVRQYINKVYCIFCSLSK